LAVRFKPNRDIASVNWVELACWPVTHGWLGPGDVVSASAELENITLQMRAHPDVLFVRCEICRRAKEWDALFAVAEMRIKVVPKKRRMIAFGPPTSCRPALFHGRMHPECISRPDESSR